MIYTEEASFPYPIISSISTDYKDNIFIFDVDIKEDGDYFNLNLNIALGSEYLKNLWNHNKIESFLIVKTQDSNFYKIDKSNTVKIKKDRLFFSTNSKLQIILRSKEHLNFIDNPDLDDFYLEDCSDILISKNSILGFSNVLLFEKSNKKSIDLFEKIVDKTISSEIKIEIREENIVIIFKNEKYQFGIFNESKRLNYPYIYMGLQKLLMEMIMLESKNEEHIFEIDKNTKINVNKKIYRKIVNLLESKNITQVSFSEIDEVISKISPEIIDQFYKGVMEESKNEN